MKKIFNFVKNNIFVFFAIYWIAQFVVGLIKFNPSALDETAKKLKAIEFGVDLIWALIFILEHSFYKIIHLIGKRIDLVSESINFISLSLLANAQNNSKAEEKSKDEDNKQI